MLNKLLTQTQDEGLSLVHTQEQKYKYTQSKVYYLHSKFTEM